MKVLLFEPMDTDFGGHYFEHSKTYAKFLLDNGYEPVFVLGGRKTEILEKSLIDEKINYYKLDIPIYKSRSTLPSIIKVPLNILMETLRLIKIIKISEIENSDLITLLTFGVYEPFQLYLATRYEKPKIPIKIIVHTITIDEKFSFNPKSFVKNMLSFFSLIFLRKMLKDGTIKNIILYSDKSEEFYSKYVTKSIIRVLHPINFDYNKFTYNKEFSKNYIGIQDKSKIFLVLNPDAKGKDIGNLIKGLESVKDDYKIVFVGYMNLKFENTLNELIEKSNLQDKTFVINKFLTTDEKYHYINASDIILLPYKTSYKKAMATSSILAEAVMLLKPVIITNGVIEGNDLVRNNSLGFVVDDTPLEWSSTIIKFLENSEKISELARTNSLKLREQFWSNNVLKEVYEINKG